MKKNISIGFTKKQHGVKGDLKVQVKEEYLDDFLKAPVVFLAIKGKQVPFFVEKIKFENDLLLKIEDINSKESAYELTSKEMFLQRRHISQKEKMDEKLVETTDLFFGKYIGFTIVDAELGKVGIIEEIIEFPQQEMAVIFQNKSTPSQKEMLIPLHENLIEKINIEKKVIYMSLPDGLLEL
ncbi:MAG TPA: 16S rRNA processing protein RimM [Phaeodactylibacter sp.]|nr:16S rRNA processing protein RimM [Phaeodactylibacter sp.]